MNAHDAAAATPYDFEIVERVPRVPMQLGLDGYNPINCGAGSAWIPCRCARAIA